MKSGNFQVFFSVLMGAMNVGQASPYVEAFSTAKAAAAAIFAVIDRKPPIDSLSVSFKAPTSVRKKIVQNFDKVYHKFFSTTYSSG